MYVYIYIYVKLTIDRGHLVLVYILQKIYVHALDGDGGYLVQVYILFFNAHFNSHISGTFSLFLFLLLVTEKLVFVE